MSKLKNMSKNINVGDTVFWYYSFGDTLKYGVVSKIEEYKIDGTFYTQATITIGKHAHDWCYLELKNNNDILLCATPELLDDLKKSCFYDTKDNICEHIALLLRTQLAYKGINWLKGERFKEHWQEQEVEFMKFMKHKWTCKECDFIQEYDWSKNWDMKCSKCGFINNENSEKYKKIEEWKCPECGYKWNWHVEECLMCEAIKDKKRSEAKDMKDVKDTKSDIKNINIGDVVYWKGDSGNICDGIVNEIRTIYNGVIDNRIKVQKGMHEWFIFIDNIIFSIPRGWMKTQSMCGGCYDNLQERIGGILQAQIKKDSEKDKIKKNLNQDPPPTFPPFFNEIYHKLIEQNNISRKEQKVIFIELPLQHLKSTLCLKLIKYFIEHNNHSDSTTAKMNTVLFTDYQAYKYNVTIENESIFSNQLISLGKDWLKENEIYYGNPSGKIMDIIIVDDMQERISENHEDIQKKVRRVTNLLDTLSLTGLAIFIGSRFREDDFMGLMEHDMQRCEIWKFPIWNRWNKKPLWEEEWSKGEIEKLRCSAGSVSFKWQYMCGLNMIIEER